MRAVAIIRIILSQEKNFWEKSAFLGILLGRKPFKTGNLKVLVEGRVFIGAEMLTIPEVIDIVRETKSEIHMKEFCKSMKALRRLTDIYFIDPNLNVEERNRNERA